MTTDSCLISGGWLLVSNVVIGGSSTFQLSLETSYRGISSYDNNKTFLTANAMLELRTHLSFTQMRFHCSKQQRRTFHVTTVANSSGEAVVQYLSGQTNVQPDACGSFVKMDDDDSLMARRCHEWGVDGWTINNVFKIGKWGPSYHSQLEIIGSPCFCGRSISLACVFRMVRDWNAMTLVLKYRLVISGKSLFVKGTDCTSHSVEIMQLS